MPGLRPTLAALLATLFAVAPALADEAQRHAQIIERLAPQDRQAYVQRLVAEQQARAGASLGADVTGPVLTAFNAPTTLNVGKAAVSFKVAVKATDDLSGVSYLYFYAYGPSGQYLSLFAYANFPSTAVNLSAGIADLNRLLEPGAWKFKYGYGYDAAGNYSYYDEATLDALGNTSFTLVNNIGYDIVKPLLTSGKILTPALSLSAFLPGTADKPLYVGVKVTATDAGTTVVAGVQAVSLYFCKVAEPSVCLSPSGSFYVQGQSTVTFSVGAPIAASSGITTGTYELSSANVYDHAGNSTYLTSTLFGGTTDFSTLFPAGTSIKIKP